MFIWRACEVSDARVSQEHCKGDNEKMRKFKNGRTRFRDPVVERIRFVQAGAVLLNAPAPDVLVEIERKRAFPVLNRLPEVARLPER